MFEGFGNLFGKIGSAILGSLITSFVTQGLNAAFGPKQPSRRDMMRDVQAQSQMLQGSQQPIRTPEQTQVDQAAVQATQARQATFAQLSKEYASLQAKGPSFDPYEEARIREETMADAAVRGMAESGQTQDLVARRLDESRLRRTSEHSRQLGTLREQMGPYAGVVQPGGTQVSQAPQIAPLPRGVPPQPFTAAPFNITGGFDSSDVGEKKPTPTPLALGLGNPYSQSPEERRRFEEERPY